MAIRQVSFGAPAAQSPLVQALAPRDPRQMLAIQALQEGTSTAPVQSIGEGLARVAQGALGGWFAGRQKRESEEASGRLADAILSGMPEAQRNGPQGAWMRAALQDETLRGPIVAAYAQSNMRQPEVPAGFRLRPDGSMEAIPGGPQDPAVVARNAAAGRDPIINGPNGIFSRDALLRGGAAQPGTQTPAQDAADYPVRAALDQLRAGESGNNPNAISRDRNGNPIAYSLYQFTPATWGDAIAADPALARYTPADIMNPEAQQVVAESHARNILRRLNPYIGQTFNGQTITPEMLIRGAWIGGPGGMERYLQTNGQYNPGDVYGTRIGDYFNGTARNLRPLERGQQQTAQAGAGGSAQPAPPPSIEQLLPNAQGQMPTVPQSAPQTREPLMARRQPGSLMDGPTQQQIQVAREVRNSHLSQPEVRNTQRVVSVLHSMQDAAGRNSAASDLNLVYGLMTILDPSSVVREGEVTMVRSTQGIPSWLVGMYERLSGGNAALLPEDRQRIMTEARSRAEGQIGIYNHLRDNDEAFLGNLDYNPNAVLGQRLRLPAAPQQPRTDNSAPAAGAQAPTIGGRPATVDQAEEELRRRRSGGR